MAAKNLRATNLKRAISILRGTPHDIYVEGLAKALREIDPRQESNQGRGLGRREHPFNMRVTDEYPDFNPTHAACLETKATATVGHGHKEPKVYEALNPLCEISWQDVLDRMTRDYWKNGQGYIECVHGDPANLEAITGLHHLPARNAWINVEDTPTRDFHYEVLSFDELTFSASLRFARFGDLESLRKRAAEQKIPRGRKAVSSVIHWRFPNTVSRYYGRPEYFSAVPSIELIQAMTQREFNFFFNNGVPEFLLFLIGAQISDADWKKLEAVLKAGQGLKGGHLSGAFNFDNPNLEVKLERLGILDQGGDKAGFGDKSQVGAMNIATAHQVPPLLAGIQIPGRMGGTNEGPNNLMLFQAQKIAPPQKALSQLLASTLGSGVPLVSAGKSATLSPEDFIGSKEDKGNGFHRITDEVSMAEMDTISRMKTPLGEGGRDPKEGLRENGQDRARTGGGPRTA